MTPEQLTAVRAKYGRNTRYGTYSLWSHADIEADINDLADAVEQLQRDLDETRQILEDLADPDPCTFDHHGYCQAHGWLTDDECADARAQRLLASRVPGADTGTEAP